MMALSRLVSTQVINIVAAVIVLISITINITAYCCCCCCCCQLLLSMIVHAMKSHPCILNEDVQAMLLCGGKRKTPLGHYGDVN